MLKTPGGAGAEQRLLLKRVDDGVYEKSQIATEIGDYQAWIMPEDTLSDEKISPVTFSVQSPTPSAASPSSTRRPCG